jgi:hypothetical protein
MQQPAVLLNGKKVKVASLRQILMHQVCESFSSLSGLNADEDK